MTHTITSNVFGGQGNQMFQVAMALIFSKKYNCMSGFVKNDIATIGKLRGINWNTLFKNTNTLMILDGNTYRIDDSTICDFIENINELTTNIYLDGYMQFSKYLIPHREYLRNFFFDTFYNDLNMNRLINKYKPEDKIAIHIRTFELTDRIGEKNINFYNTTSWCYYKSVLSRYEELKNKEILMFIDDVANIEEVKKYFPEFVLVNETEDISLYIMSKCKYLIRSNSTFSWWAAFLSESLKTVFIPDSNWSINNNSFNQNNLLDNFIQHTLL